MTRSCRNRPSARALSGVAVVTVAIMAGSPTLAGCGSTDDGAVDTSTPPSPANPPATSAAQPEPAAGVGISPAGVTTRVDAPAASTEEEYFQACHAAKVWMDDQPDDPATLVEPYLRVVQVPGPAGPGTWDIPWAQLTADRQSAVIVAAQAAAGGECG